jgi:hypothetical protein
MSIFDRLFNANAATGAQPEISFGRYSDAYKSPERYEAWDQSLALFEKQDYLESYQRFFYYLRDDAEDNVRWEETRGGLKFELYQGSQKITGMASPLKVRAEARVVKAPDLKVGFMRRLMEHNYNLRFSRFALDDDGNITIVFDTYTLDGSPYKLYHALKELATKADKQDDLLLEEFKILQPVDTSHLRPLPPAEKETKYQFIRQEIGAALGEVEHGTLDSTQYAGSFAYLLLALIYKLDYLIKPEGFMMETLELLHRKYYENDSQPTVYKNQALCKGLRQLLERDKESSFQEMYRGKSTFGITNSIAHEYIAGLIDGELPKMDWYQERGFAALALAIPHYIVGHCLFNFAVPLPDRRLFHLYYQVTEADYFRQLGFQTDYYDPASERFDVRGIKRAINMIRQEALDSHPNFEPDTKLLDFDSLPDFARSFLLMARNLDLAKTD